MEITKVDNIISIKTDDNEIQYERDKLQVAMIGHLQLNYQGRVIDIYSTNQVKKPACETLLELANKINEMILE